MPELPERIRAFVAIRVSEAVEHAIAELIDEVRSPGDGIKWVAPANLHLTLKFLGPSVPVSKIERFRHALSKVAAATAPFELAVRKLGSFPSLDRPRIIWVGLEGAGVVELARRVEEAAVRCSFERERRAFAAHLTIARVVGSQREFAATLSALERVRERDLGVSRITEMTLYSSTLTPNGSIYEVLAAFPFTAYA